MTKPVCEFEFIGKMHLAQSSKVSKEMVQDAKRAGIDPREFVPQFAFGLRFGKSKFVMSVQASCGHYCEPRLTLNDFNKYESFEVALFKDGGKSMWSAKKVLGDDSELAKMLDEKYFKGKVFAYVPKEKVELLYQAMQEKFGGCVNNDN